MRISDWSSDVCSSDLTGGQRFADAAHIVRIDMLKAVAKDDPVDRPPVGLGARLARVPDQLRIEAGARDLKGFGVDLSEQVEIDEAVVYRGNERVGARSKVAREDIVAPRRGGDEIVGALAIGRASGRE